MVSAKKPVLLLVDDELVLLKLMSYEFQSSGFEVLTAENGTAAFEIVKEKKVDIILSDVRMNHGDGIDLLKKVRKRDPVNPPVILLTGYSDVTKNEALKMGAADYLQKPAKFDDLCQKVQETLMKSKS